MSYLEENHTEGEEPTLPKTRSKSRSKKNLIAALVLVLLAFFGFGVYGDYRYYCGVPGYVT